MNILNILFVPVLIVSGFVCFNNAKAVTYIHCTCHDSVGSWHASCYSTSNCDTCCSFIKKSPLGDHRNTAMPHWIEPAKDKADDVSSKRRNDQKRSNEKAGGDK